MLYVAFSKGLALTTISGTPSLLGRHLPCTIYIILIHKTSQLALTLFLSMYNMYKQYQYRLIKVTNDTLWLPKVDR